MGGLLAALGGPVISAIISAIFGPLENIMKAYFNKEISKEEAQARLSTALAQSFAEVDKSHADSIAKTYASFMALAEKSLLVRVTWAIVVYVQLFVLFWHQMAIPFIVYMGWIARYPSSGATVEWSYALLGGLLGLGVVALRTGPAASYIDRYKAAIKR